MRIARKKSSNYLQLVELAHLHRTGGYRLQKPDMPIAYHSLYPSSTILNASQTVKVILVGLTLNKLAVEYPA